MKAMVPAWRANSLSNNWFSEFEHLFDHFFDQQALSSLGIACDVEETEQFLLFSFDLPGLDEKDISVEIKDGVLSVSGERKQETRDEKIKTFRGRQYGSFQQNFAIPKSIDQEKIEADYTNGVLKILLPKQEEVQPKKIEVKNKKGGFLSGL